MRCGEITTLLDLVTESIVGSYVAWALNDQHVLSNSLSCFGILYAAIRHNPKYKQQDLTWFGRLMMEIRLDPESDLQARKALKYLPYDILSKIPQLISQQRGKEKKGTKQYARLLHDELMLQWLLILPWRQRNIREARLGTPEKDNIFKTGFSSLVNIAKPQWVEEELSRDPGATFWQVFFRKHETKTGQEVRGVIPKQLVPLLEEYLQFCRRILIGRSDPGTLFVNRRDGVLLDREVTSLIGNLTVRYAGKRVTPHLFRDSYAHCWLDDHPED